MDARPAVEVDALGLLCPLPVLRAQRAIARLASGEVLVLHADDEGVVDDVPAWCEGNGHELLAIERGDGRYRCWVRRS